MNRLINFFNKKSFRLFQRRSTLPKPTPTGQASQITPANTPGPSSGLDLIFTLLGERMARQSQAADQIDTKVAGIIVGGTTLVGFAFLIQHHPSGNCSVLIPSLLHHWPIMVKLGLPYVPFLAFYILTMFFALRAYRIQTYTDVPNPKTALRRIGESERDLKFSLSKAMAHYSEYNQDIINGKAVWAQRATNMLLVEIATLVLLLVYQTIC